MAARRLTMKCRQIFTLLAVSFIASASVAAQNSATLTGRVSGTVALSVAPTFNASGVEITNVGVNTVRITLSGEDPVIRLPLLLRSNSSFKISAISESTNAALTQVQVTDIQTTGTLVSPKVRTAVDINRTPD